MPFFRSFTGIAICMFSGFLMIAHLEVSASNPKDSVYKVYKTDKEIPVNGKWDKPAWEKIKAVEINNFIRDRPEFFPHTQAKMMYDDENLYVIFKVNDRYVRSITTTLNGPVWEDAAVEFFFSPDSSKPANYFNLEVNCGGTALLEYSATPRANATTEDIKEILMAHSLPKIVDPEITQPVTWTLEYKIPLKILEKYSNITRPKQGVKWRANFYKIVENNSNPHHLTWSPIGDPKPHFHMPKFFGILEFQ